jgi:hypothetical protein
MTAKSETYTFTHKGKTYEIPSVTAMPIGVMRKAAKAESEFSQAFIILEQVCGEDSPELAAIDTMLADEFAAFIKGWTQGAPLGE